MKRIISIMVLLCLVFSMAISASAIDVKDSEKLTYSDEETGVDLPYRLVLPANYDPKYQFQLVVFFHGAGERGMENEKNIENCVQDIADHMPKAIILVPQCSHMDQWVDTPWAEGCYSVDEVEESDDMQAVMNLIREITETYSVNKDTIYAMGYSMGGFAVWDAMVRHNDVFAAGVAVCGGGDPSKAEVLKDTPMFVFHGTADDAVPVSASADTVNAIVAAGGTKVVYEEFAGSGHGIWGHVFARDELYTKIKTCKLTDRYPDIFDVKEEVDETQPTDDLLYYILAGAGVVLVVLIVVLVVCGKKRKQAKLEETENTDTN